MDETRFCEKCKHTMNADQFYQTNNLEKYPDGKLSQCKKCATMHIDNFNADTYVWLLQECDVPYIPKEWHGLLEKYGKDRNKLTGTTILGRYLSKMKLKQYKDYRWKDNEFLQELENIKIEEAMRRQGYEQSEIVTVLSQQDVPVKEAIQPTYVDDIGSSQFEDDYFAQQAGESDDLVADLTEEDLVYLRLKWGRTYKPEEWVRLEQLYEEMTASYDIQGAGHVDTLKLICKTSLKANQLLDIGDIEGAQKMIKMDNDLMKSGKFTAAQNKAESGEFIDSLGELIELCEKEGYIERFYIEEPNDKVDLTIRDMQRYTRTLIERETNLSVMVEKAVRENAKEDQEALDNPEDTIVDINDLAVEELEKVLGVKDIEEFDDFLDGAGAEDENFLGGI